MYTSDEPHLASWSGHQAAGEPRASRTHGRTRCTSARRPGRSTCRAIPRSSASRRRCRSAPGRRTRRRGASREPTTSSAHAAARNAPSYDRDDAARHDGPRPRTSPTSDAFYNLRTEQVVESTRARGAGARHRQRGAQAGSRRTRCTPSRRVRQRTPAYGARRSLPRQRDWKGKDRDPRARPHLLHGRAAVGGQFRPPLGRGLRLRHRRGSAPPAPATWAWGVQRSRARTPSCAQDFHRVRGFVI